MFNPCGTRGGLTMKKSKLFVLASLGFAFCSISFAMDQSILDAEKTFAKKYYNKFITSAEKNPSLSLMEQIHKADPDARLLLVKESYNDNKISPIDLRFAIQNTNFLDPERKESLFEYAIIDRLKHRKLEHREAVVKLLTEQSFERSPSTFDKWWYSDRNYSLKCNLLVDLIESANFAALDAILRAWPKELASKLKDPALLANFPELEKSQNLSQWLDYKMSLPSASHLEALQNLKKLLPSSEIQVFATDPILFDYSEQESDYGFAGVIKNMKDIFFGSDNN